MGRGLSWPALGFSFLPVLDGWKEREFGVEWKESIRRLDFPFESVVGAVPSQNEAASLSTKSVSFVCKMESKEVEDN